MNAACLPINNARFSGSCEPKFLDLAHFPVVFMRQQLICATVNTERFLVWLERMKTIDVVGRSIAYAGLQLPLSTLLYD
jgi:hypothetical protein